MPIYEYRCEQCGHELERLQRMGDDPLRDCPACEKPELRRLISAAGFRLKGAGWYETDFKQGNKRNLADSGSNESAAENGSGEGASKSESAKTEPVKSTDKAPVKTDSKTPKESKDSPA